MRRIFAATLGAALLLAAAVGLAGAQTGETQYTQTGTLYKLTLTIGPVMPMLMPDQAAGAMQGEVMVPMPGMPVPQMVTTDQGQPVNHHLEVAIADKTTGAVISNTLPAITIRNQTTGASRDLTAPAAMYDVTKGPTDLHYGNNVYLPDGTYTIIVTVTGDTVAFRDVAVSGGSAAPTMAPMPAATPEPTMAAVPQDTAMPGTGTTGSNPMPTTGASDWAGWAALLTVLLLVLLAGLTLRRAGAP